MVHSCNLGLSNHRSTHLGGIVRSLLFVDMLGVRARWHQDGRAGAETAFRQFERLVTDAIRHSTGEVPISASLESDAAALVCNSQHDAVCIGKALYLDAFRVFDRKKHGRPWLRGAILPFSDDFELRSQRPAGVGGLMVIDYQPGLLEAIAVEKAGYKGMRLLISEELVNDGLRSAHCETLSNGQKLHVFRQMTHSNYPGRLADGWQDVLWMATPDASEWQDRQRRMARRLRYAAKDSEESLQAAATQVLFHECDAIFGTLVGDPRE